MRRVLWRPPSHLSAILHLSQPPLTCNCDGSVPKLGRTTCFTSIFRWVFMSSSLPPPEWIDPFVDLSDLASRSCQNLNPSPWVHQIISLLDGSSKMESNLDSFCHKFLIKLSPSFVSFVLRSTEVQKNPHVAWRFFIWAGKQKKYTHNIESYVSLIDVFSAHGDLDRVKFVFTKFTEMRGNAVAVNAMFYSSLIDGFGKLGRVDEAEKLFEEMVQKGCPPDSYCYNALNDALAKCSKIDEALTVFKRMEMEGCDQTVYTFTIIISGLFREHRTEEALELWDVMIDKGITPTAAAFRALSIGLCLSGKVARACKILDELAPMGVILETAFEDMLNILCKAGRVKEACKLADGIVDRGREIPGRVRTILINALRKAGNADLALKLMHSKIGIGYDRMGSIKRRVKFRILVES
uniref:Pentacotripeptide-repeat region of PRORP domain-containing protein n=1 Tax=Manihot esculenta TaxID=3983 RepID=A0A2C9UUY6_MANES